MKVYFVKVYFSKCICQIFVSSKVFFFFLQMSCTKSFRRPCYKFLEKGWPNAHPKRWYRPLLIHVLLSRTQMHKDLIISISPTHPTFPWRCNKVSLNDCQCQGLERVHCCWVVGVRWWTLERPLSLDTRHPDDGWARSDDGGGQIANCHLAPINWQELATSLWGMGRGWDGGHKVKLDKCWINHDPWL